MIDGQSLSPAAVPGLPLNVRVRNYRGKILVGGYQNVMELSETAGFIWRQIDGTRSVAEIGRLVAQEYEIDESTAVTDVGELIVELVAHDLVLVKP